MSSRNPARRYMVQVRPELLPRIDKFIEVYRAAHGVQLDRTNAVNMLISNGLVSIRAGEK